MAKRYSFIEFVAVNSATQCFSSASTVIAGTVIAASSAAIKPGVSSGGMPINGTNRVRAEGSTITTTSGNIGGEAVKNKIA